MPSPIDQLRNIMRQLRDPETGCAWDLAQNFKSIAEFTLEEAYEVVDAIERDDIEDLKDELGDLLLQVVFHAQMASEQDLFNFDDVAQAISDKMLRRHPHVFGDVVFETEHELKASWEAIKAEERRQKLARQHVAFHKLDVEQPPQPVSALDGIAPNLPALKRADKTQKRAARVGFDWPDINPVWDKLAEEATEVREAIDTGEQDSIEDEIGDLLFTVVNLARHAGIDSEAALRRASLKFERRFRDVELQAAGANKTLVNMQLSELDALWDKAKERM